ncbi:MAG TPA: hypothetical protein H9880_01555 [Candidatus Anaerobutyricum avicola]|nr:hypothetical protein [Candidatus Anaerobutyricum avicola]
MSNKDRFKVYSNDNMPKKNQEEEMSVELEVPHEDLVTGLFVTSPYFMEMMMSQDYFYYPVNVEAEESLMAPMLSPEVLHDFLENTEAFREEEGIPTALLLHIPVEDEDEEQEMVSLFDGVVQSEFTKFFHTVIAVMNPETALEETFEDVFESLMDEMAENGYLDKVINNIANYMSDPEVMEAMLFPDEDEDDEE